MVNKFKVIFDGFETLEQAQAFADWSKNHVGEVLLDKNTILDFISNHQVADEETREIILPINLYKK